AADDFAAQLDVGDLVFADGDKQGGAFFRIHDDVGGLQARVAEEAVGVKVFVLHVFKRFFVGGDALEPTERRDHREEQVQLGVFRDKRLLEEDRFLWVEAGGE